MTPAASPPTVRTLLREASVRIDGADAQLLLAHALGHSRGWLFAHAEDAVPEAAAQAFADLLERRRAGEPVAYLTGHRGFWSFDLAVSPATLIPRPETERLVELALERLPEGAPLRVADLGTGTGAIALALAHERPQAHVVATDLSAAALEIAGANARALRLANLEFRLGSWWAPLKREVFDLVASNPPYIALGDPHLDQGDLRFEPATALSSGADGLDAIRAIVRQAPTHLAAGGWLLLEHGWEQGEAVRALLQAAGLVEVATCQDLEGRDRVSVGRRA